MTDDEDDNDDEIATAGVAYDVLAVSGTYYTVMQRDDIEQPGVRPGSYNDRFVEHIPH